MVDRSIRHQLKASSFSLGLTLVILSLSTSTLVDASLTTGIRASRVSKLTRSYATPPAAELDAISMGRRISSQKRNAEPTSGSLRHSTPLTRNTSGSRTTTRAADEEVPELFIGKVFGTFQEREIVVSVYVPVLNLEVVNASNVGVSLMTADGTNVPGAQTVLPLVPGFVNDEEQEFILAKILINDAMLLVNKNLILKVDGENLIAEHSEMNNEIPFVLPDAGSYVENLTELAITTFLAHSVAIAYVNNELLRDLALQIAATVVALHGATSFWQYDTSTNLTAIISDLLSPLPDVVIVLGQLEPTLEFLRELVTTSAVVHPVLQIILSNDLITPSFASKLKSLSGAGLEVLPPMAGICYEGQTPLTVCQIINDIRVPGLVMPMAALPPPLLAHSPAGRRHMGGDEESFVNKVKRVLEDADNQDLLEEAIEEAKKLRKAIKKIEKNVSKFKKIKKLLDIFIKTSSISNAADQAEALADVLDSLSGLIPLPPGIDSFMEYYVEAIKSISKALSNISQNIKRRDTALKQVVNPGAWPGGWTMWALYCSCEFDDLVVQWVIKNRQLLAFVFGEDPVKYESVTSFWVLGIIWWEEVNKEHMKEVLTNPKNLKILKKVLYGNADPNCPKDSIKRRKKNCPKKSKQKKD